MKGKGKRKVKIPKRERDGEAKAEWRCRLNRADGFSVFCPGRSKLPEMTTRKKREMMSRDTNYTSALPFLQCFRRAEGVDRILEEF